MSLKNIHLIVMGISVLFALGFGFWAIQDFRFGTHSILNLSLGILSLITSAVMIYYMNWFRQELSRAHL